MIEGGRSGRRREGGKEEREIVEERSGRKSGGGEKEKEEV